MDGWIIAESESIAERIRGSLHALGLGIPPSRVNSIEATSSAAETFADFDGILFLAAEELLPSHLELVAKLREAAHQNATIIVIASVEDPATVLMSIRAGASDLICLNKNFEDELISAIIRIESSRKQEDLFGGVISVVPCLEAIDASLLSVNLAAIIAKSVGACGLLDFQMRGGDLAMLLKVNPRHTIVDLLKQQDTIDKAILRQALTSHESGIDLLAGPESSIDLRSLRPQVCQQILGVAKKMHRFVVVNSEDIQLAEQVRVLAESNKIVLAMRPDVLSLKRAKQHLEIFSQARIPREKVYVVVLATGYSTELQASSITKVLQTEDLLRIPDDPASVLCSINVGNPLVDECPNTRISQALKGVAETLLGKLEKDESTQPRKRKSGVTAALSAAFQTLSFSR